MNDTFISTEKSFDHKELVHKIDCLIENYSCLNVSTIAQKFYERLGMQPQRLYMEAVLGE